MPFLGRVPKVSEVLRSSGGGGVLVSADRIDLECDNRMYLLWCISLCDHGRSVRLQVGYMSTQYMVAELVITV